MPMPQNLPAAISRPASLHGPDGRAPTGRGSAINECPGTATVPAGPDTREAVS
jgi:hypothetical protein